MPQLAASYRLVIHTREALVELRKLSTTRIDPTGAQPTDPPWARLLFVLVQGRDGQWWRGFLLMALTGLLLVGVLGALLVFAGWVGGGLGVGSLTALAVARRRRR